MVINSKTEKLEAAWKLAKFLAGREGAEILARNQIMPGYVDEAVLERFKEAPGFPENGAEALITETVYMEWPPHRLAGLLGTMVNEEIVLAMTGNKSIDQAIADMKARREELPAQPVRGSSVSPVVACQGWPPAAAPDRLGMGIAAGDGRRSLPSPAAVPGKGSVPVENPHEEPPSRIHVFAAQPARISGFYALARRRGARAELHAVGQLQPRGVYRTAKLPNALAGQQLSHRLLEYDLLHWSSGPAHRRPLARVGPRAQSWPEGAAVRAVHFVPHIASTVAVAVVWQFLYHPDMGPINQFLSTLGSSRRLVGRRR